VQKPGESSTQADPRHDYLDRVARSLASAHAPGNLTTRRIGRSIAPTAFDRQFEQIFDALGGLDAATLDKLPGIEWLLDNDYVIQEAIAILDEGYPRDGYRRLPLLATAPRRGELRVLALADEILNVCGTPMELSWAKRFVVAYQTHAELSLGELWALPNMLRYVALERLANAARSLLSAAATSEHSIPDYSEAIASYVINLRNLNAQDWNAFIEFVSEVHQALCLDPAGAYDQMDVATRNRYRNQVEVIARRTRCTESAVVRQALALCEERPKDAPPRSHHVGYYLIDEGLIALASTLNGSRLWSFTLPARFQQGMAWWYLGSVALLTAPILWFVALFLPPNNLTLTLLLPLALVLSLTISICLVHWLVGLWCKPRTLPKLDFRSGVPAAWTTAVVTPAMLSTSAEITHLIERLEKNYLGNPDPALRYVLLTDFLDADVMHRDEDSELLTLATEAVGLLNTRYDTELLRPFFLYHRQREWNEREACYMAKERKRGKLSALDRLLLGDREAEQPLVVGSAEHLRGIRFVITLDADTQLPPGVATTLIGTLAHPLNQPVMDGPRVVNGYNIIQPRLEVDPEVANRNRFTRAFAGDVALDLYSHAVSNVYQDLFGVGIFAGKGIYDVHAFERSLDDRVPDNAILSHDLFEGLHGRVGLATDIVLFEDYPTTLPAYERRAHRWIRGDWQLLPWLVPFVPSQQGRVRTRFSVLDRWKMVDNLRRSLLPLVTLAALIAAWTVFPGQVWLWTVGIAAVSGVPIALSSAHAVSTGVAQGGTPQALFEHLSSALRRDGARWLFLLAYLPYESVIAIDAIARTLWRLAVTRRHLLQWQPAAIAVQQVASKMSARYIWQQMVAAPATALVVGSWLVWVQPSTLWSAGPFLIAWLLAPQIAIWSMRAPETARDENTLSEAQRRSLHKVAVRTWHFFEHFAGPENHWLPPDNYHEAPEVFVSKRTSPTNIGLTLLATLAAYDLGYLSLSALLSRLRHTFESLHRLEQHRGHFLNWYRVDDLTALEPRYVSAVDSGNLAASLMTLKSALLEIEHEPLHITRLKGGAIDVTRELADTLESIGVGDPLQSRLEALIENLSGANSTADWCTLIQATADDELPKLRSLALAALASQDSQVGPEALAELRRSYALLHGGLQTCRHECLTLMPWCFWPENLAASADVQQGFESIRHQLTAIPDLASVPDQHTRAVVVLAELSERLTATPGEGNEATRTQLDTFREELTAAAAQAQQHRTTIQRLVSETDALLAAMDFSFLFDADRHLLRLGYTVSTAEYDPNHYDLLASEARLASFVGIVKGDLPLEHWLHLGRPFTRVGNKRALASWSATAFEYLMPHLLMQAPEATLLTESCRLAIEQQRTFAKGLEVPWGISESGFYQLDKQAHYQYRAFGVPGLGLRAEQRFRVVITPYASLLALPFSTQSVMSNLAALQELNMLGRFGLFEAIDFGQSDASGPRRGSIVRSYMSHHQGMIMTALDNALRDGAMVRRFHADPGVAIHAHLLFEQIPQGIAAHIGWREQRRGPPTLTRPTTLQGWRPTGSAEAANLNVLSNGHYQVMLDQSGMSASFYDGLCLARWEPDPCDQQGTTLFIKDLDSGVL
jgi:cyclic beta-1,2-glucan synthetase